MIKIAVYGTLRRGEVNFDALDAPLYICTTKLKGYALYDAGLPIATRSEKDSIVVDIIKVNTRDWRLIGQMERGAGYSLDITHDQEEHNDLPIWIVEDIYDGPLLTPKKIKSGDWIENRRKRGYYSIPK